MGDIQQDPSMEEILASIKRVIREDGRATGQARPPRRQVQSAAAAPPPPVTEPPEEEDVLELNEAVREPERLVSEDAAVASRQALAALTAIRQPSANDTSPLEAVVRDMLRPILKDWLDHHLPQIVEELVTREISRITGRNL
jgi:cell pole-organizing protein PopZ